MAGWNLALPPTENDHTLAKKSPAKEKADNFFMDKFDRVIEPLVVTFCKKIGITKNDFITIYIPALLDMFGRLRNVHISNFYEGSPLIGPRRRIFNTQLALEKQLLTDSFGSQFAEELINLLIPEFEDLFVNEMLLIHKIR